MLIYRGFAERATGRGYVPGPALDAGPVGQGRIGELRAQAQPLLEELVATVRETVNLVVCVGGEVRFLTTVEGSRPVRVGDRQGAVLPAYRASAGKAMLSMLDQSELERLYHGENATARRLTEEDYAALVRELGAVRDHGFAANFEGTEEGVSALGVAVSSPAGEVVSSELPIRQNFPKPTSFPFHRQYAHIQELAYYERYEWHSRPYLA